MAELATYQSGLPDTIEDIAKFLLIAPEKAVALRAEIRAIKKANLAKEVYDQKIEENRVLQELILDASVRLGELTRKIPKATKAQGNQYTGKWKSDTVVNNPKPKSEVVRELGLIEAVNSGLGWVKYIHENTTPFRYEE